MSYSFSLPILLLSAVLLAACSTQPPAPEQPVPAVVATPAAEPEAAAAAPDRPIPPDSVYPLLLAEFALRRRAYDTALETYLEQSLRLNDAGVARHTTHLAQYLRDEDRALEAVQQWLALEPDNVEANNTAATLLARQQRPLEAMPHMATVARSDVQANFPLLLQGFSQLTPEEQSRLVAGLNDLQQEFPRDPALLLTQALLHTEFNQYDEALAKLDHLLAIEPYQHQALLLEARVRLEQEDSKPFARIEQALKVNPDDSQLRLEYAKLLTRSDMEAAREQFEILSARSPDDVDLLFSLALINREAGDDIIASAYLKQMLALDKRTDEAHYYLGVIAEDQRDYDLAVSHFEQVGEGRHYMAANQRLGQILVDAGHFERYAAWFSAQRQLLPTRAEQLFGLEAELLGASGYLQGSRSVLNRGIADFPDSAALRYARAMLAEQQGDLALMERDLRDIIARDPDNATALNALGYTLANRTDRYDEAHGLIARALELDPREPAILDSMGWVLYRLGRHAEALEYLSRAYALFPDPEVAAHLGEVLWVLGERDRAAKVWRGALLKSPEHQVVTDTLERLGVSALEVEPVATGSKGDE